MPSYKRKYTPESRPGYRGGYVNYINTGHLQRGGGFGGILKGWIKRAIPIIKSKAVPLAKSIGRDLAVHTLDSAYEVGRNILVNKKDPLDAVYDQGKKEVNYFKDKITHPFQTNNRSKAIKRKSSLTPFSLNRNVKRKRPSGKFTKIKRNNFGFRKVSTL